MKKFNANLIVRDFIKKLKPYEIKEIPYKIKLDANESPFPVKLSDITTDVDIDLNRYPDPEAIQLKKALSKKLKISYKDIIVGNGSDELIYYLILTFGGPVIYPVPTFAMYGIIAQSVGVERLEVSLDNDFDIDFEKMTSSIISKRPHIIFLSSPNNPTGNTFSSDKILGIIELARQKSSLVVIDEAYHPFCSKNGFLPFLKDFDNLVILRTLSKIGFAGLRVGYLIGNQTVLQEINKVRLPYNLDALSQYVAEQALTKFYSKINSFIKEIIKERQRLYKELLKINGIKVFISEANFILFKIKESKKIYNELSKRGILIRDLSSILPDSLRVTVGTKQENDEFLKELKTILEVLK
ncbi:histidinol-phosphate transaminase [Thermodesulfovibrio thiophilus]|uniref:histidinol-phosphate transaminase n=1 Tax=Thermodesulfovibrio thiophilus TaxID=340095 RepID=UPI000428FF2F|nr:histidinol-phosphate transaminase [Thermodesulfovibrio thiophilus]